MELKEIAAISGKGGLFRILKPTRNGVIVESLDSQKKKLAVSASSKVSVLKEISIYTTDKEGALALEEVFFRIFEKYQLSLPIESKAESAALMAFIGEVVPEYDINKVYPSDIKKLVTWYAILAQEVPALLDRAQSKAEEAPAQEEAKAESSEPTTKKAPAKSKKTESESSDVAKEEKPKKAPAKAKKAESESSETPKEEKPKAKKAPAKKKKEEGE